jgi:hypothetical protein
MRRREASPRRISFGVGGLGELVHDHQRAHSLDKGVQGKHPERVLSFATMLSK